LKLDNPITATLAGILDRAGNRGADLGAPERLDGRTILVTGANSGIGKAVALALARGGARLLLACRGGIPEAGEEIARASGNPAVEMLPVDFSDFASVHRLCDALRDRGERLDAAVLNAGVMPGRSQRTRDGLELMFQVNYAANVLLTRRLLADGVIPNRFFAEPGGARPAGERRPRVVIVSSESHRSAKPLDPDTLGDPVAYGMLTGMAQYARTKLLLCTLATELGRRLRDDAGVDVAVHAVCPGAVDTNVARDAPPWLRPVLKPLMRRFFSTPEAAAPPIVHLATASALEGRTGIYLHLTREKEPSPEARDAAMGRRLWEASQALIDRLAPGPAAAP
jgi:NAD(P)-dependent dehydrogenase (short-subunit alcohol dehydrogenase family)